MEIEQMEKKIEWLDNERRKDKNTIATLDKRLAEVESVNASLVQQLRDSTSELTRLTALAARLEQFDSTLAQTRVEFGRMLEAAEKQRDNKDRELELVRRGDVDAINKSIAGLKKDFEAITEIKKNLQARQDEEFRLSRLMDEVSNKVEETLHEDEEYRRAQRLVDEGRRQDSKRLTDLQGEVAALRKRQDELRGKADLLFDNLRKLELRQSELLAAEAERKQAQAAFMEKQNLIIVERERLWTEWQERFEQINQQAAFMETQVSNLDATNRSLKRAQESFEEITQRFDRRVNEVSEMHRLTEERFRQEWTAFKADDQKRWTNFTLSQEEQQRESGRQFQKSLDRLTALEDLAQEMKDLLDQMESDSLNHLQGLQNMMHDWLEDYEKTHVRLKPSGV